MLKDDVLQILQPGIDTAITGPELAKIFDFKTDRHIRNAIRELIADGVPIAATTHYPGGYYIAKTREEAEDYLRLTKSRLVENAYRRRDFKRAARAILQPGQPVLF